jgi:hypothetical protein
MNNIFNKIFYQQFYFTTDTRAADTEKMIIRHVSRPVYYLV